MKNERSALDVRSGITLVVTPLARESANNRVIRGLRRILQVFPMSAQQRFERDERIDGWFIRRPDTSRI